MKECGQPAPPALLRLARHQLRRPKRLTWNLPQAPRALRPHSRGM